MAQGSAGLGWRRGGDSTTWAAGGIRGDCLSCIALLCGVLCHRATPFRLWFGINRLVTLDVATEAEAHGREHLLSKGVFLPRAESDIQRRGNYVCRDRLLDCSFHRPATF